jgi:DNA-binding protein HU-beta
MYKTALVRRVARETGVSQRVVRQVVGASLDTIEAALTTGDRVTLPGFGTFYTSQRRGGRIRSVRTGRQVEVPARRVAAFRVGDVL